MAPATRQRVRDAADALDYVVNVRARNLRSARSGSIGLYVPDQRLSFRYYMDVAFGAVERAQEDGVLVTLMPTAFHSDAGITSQLDGFIVIDPVNDDTVVETLLRGRRPVVSGEDSPPGLPRPAATVFGDHRSGIRLLLDHLWENGSRGPACILPDDSIAWGREMREGYEQWCAEKGIAPREIVGSFETMMADVRARVEELLADRGETDAIIGTPEGTALVAVDAVRAAGLEVGRDMLIASYIDSDPLALTEPSITALDVRPREFGRACMTLLLKAIDGAIDGGVARDDAAPTRLEVPITLVPRRSTLRKS